MPLRIEPPLYRRRVDFYTKSRAFDTHARAHRAGLRAGGRSARRASGRTAAWYRAQGTVLLSENSRPCAAEHRPHLRSPRLGRVAHARRQAAVRLDDSALRQGAVQRLADQPAPEGLVGRHARAVRHRRHLPDRHKFDPATLHGAAEGAAIASRPTSCTCTATARRRSGGCARGAMRALPSSCTSTRTMTDTPWFQKVADSAAGAATPIWRSRCRESTAEFTIRARLMPAERTRWCISARRSRSSAGRAAADEIAAARAGAGDRRRRRSRSAPSRG